MKKWKRFKACVIDRLSIKGGHIIIEVVIKSYKKNLYRACFEIQCEKDKVPEIKNNDFSAIYLRGYYYGFGVRRKSISSHDIDWSECRRSVTA